MRPDYICLTLVALAAQALGQMSNIKEFKLGTKTIALSDLLETGRREHLILPRAITGMASPVPSQRCNGKRGAVYGLTIPATVTSAESSIVSTDNNNEKRTVYAQVSAEPTIRPYVYGEKSLRRTTTTTTTVDSSGTPMTIEVQLPGAA
jgi:hypothetical protein